MSSPAARVRLLMRTDVSAFRELRLEALREAPESFGSDLERELAFTLEDFAMRIPEPGGFDAAFGAFDGARLIGTLTLLRRPLAKTRHKAEIFGVYVTPAQRRSGVARALLEAALAHARAFPEIVRLELGVVTTNVGAIRLYERAGFVAWGTEPDVFRVDARSFDDLHLSLKL